MVKFLSVILICSLFGPGGKILVLKSTSQDWIGGMRETGYGTEYQIKIKVKAGSEQLQIDDLWIGDQHVKFRLVADPANSLQKTFTKGSEISIRAAITFRPGPDEKVAPTGTDSIRRPFNFKGEGLLGYSYKGKKAYLEIAEFKKLEKLIYP